MEGPEPPVDRPVQQPANLTPRQARILARYAAGASFAEIAAEEYIGRKKIFGELSAIREKLGVPNTVATIMAAHRLGYISHPDDSGVIRSLSPFRDRA